MAVVAMIGGFVQVILALLVVVGFFLLAFFIFNKEAIEAAAVKRSVRQKTYIFRGIKDLKDNNDETYDTSDRSHPTFREMPNSVNQLGGAEFTYSFWMYKSEKSVTTPKLSFGVNDELDDDDLVLLVRGSNRKQDYLNICKKETSLNNVLVKCPLIKFQGQSWEYLVVELNTVQTPTAVKEQSKNICGSTAARGWSKANSHKIALAGFDEANFIDKWFNVTVTVSDTEPKDNLPVRNKVHVRIYVNGVLELDKYVDNNLGDVTSENPSLLLQNNGPLHVAPQLKKGSDGTGRVNPLPTKDDGQLYMANLAYMSYTASPEEVKALYKEGFDRNIAPSVSQSSTNADRYRDSMKNKSTTSGEPQLRSF